jgi:hypothetical protein
MEANTKYHDLHIKIKSQYINLTEMFIFDRTSATHNTLYRLIQNRNELIKEYVENNEHETKYYMLDLFEKYNNDIKTILGL